MQVSSKRKWMTRGKILFEEVILFFLYRGMKVLYKYDTRICEEICGREGAKAVYQKGIMGNCESSGYRRPGYQDRF